MVSGFKSLWYELGIMGLLLLSAAIALNLTSLTLAATAQNVHWHNAITIAMIVVSCVCLLVILLLGTSA